MSLFDKDELRGILKNAKELSGGVEQVSRKEFLGWLSDFSSSLKQQLSISEQLDPNKKNERVKKAFEDFNYFRQTYFPHYYTIKSESKLQKSLKEVFSKIRDKKGKKDLGEKYAKAAPRGFGKSTDVSVVFPIYCICYDLKHFITIFSDAIELTETLIEAIKVELTENQALIGDFQHATGMTQKWKIGEFVSTNNIKTKGFGSGKRARGIKHGVYRPDLAIIDDLENDENVRSRKQRDKLEEWLDSTLDNLGSVENELDIIYIGTILHRDSVLARKLKLGFWNPQIFKALEKYPNRIDLWDEYSLLFRKYGLQKSKEFYQNNKEKMDDGAILLWDGVRLESLMQKRATNKKAFEKEQQNQPNAESQAFDSSRFKTISFTQMPKIDLKIAYTDFKGNSKKGEGDYTAIIAGGINKEQRKLYVYLSKREQIKGKDAVLFLYKAQKEHSFDVIGGETNGGFFLYKEWYKDMCYENNTDEGTLIFKSMNNSKEERISTLEYPIDEEDIIFVGDHTELFNELDDFPEGEFDDLADGLAGLWRISKLAKKQGKKRTRYKNKAKEVYR